MSLTAEYRSDAWHGASPKRRGPARGGWRALFRGLQRWWAKERYRPERRYMRG